jgi:hypothetical protein
MSPKQRFGEPPSIHVTNMLQWGHTSCQNLHTPTNRDILQKLAGALGVWLARSPVRPSPGPAGNVRKPLENDQIHRKTTKTALARSPVAKSGPEKTSRPRFKALVLTNSQHVLGLGLEKNSSESSCAVLLLGAVWSTSGLWETGNRHFGQMTLPLSVSTGAVWSHVER